MTTRESTLPSNQPSTARVVTWIKGNALLAYFLLAFGLTWPFMIAEVLGSWGVIPFRLTLSVVGLPLILFIAYGPTLAALIVTGVTSGKVGIRALLGRLLIWRVGWPWYIVVIFGSALLGWGALQLYALRSGMAQPLPAFSWEMLLLLPVSFLVRGAINGEEIGWRGFALPHLQTRWSALTASVLLGGVWALFHLPIFFVQGKSVLGSQTEMNPFVFLVEVVAGAIVMTWLFNNTQGSLLIAYLYHAAVNTWTSEIFRSTSIDGTLLTVAVAVLVVIIFGPARLIRKPLRQQSAAEPVVT